ncbi:hypothetical protein [Lentzea sp. NBRC 102530]|uniref:hypothetical protein n=1 Tax=Lentzea sp. NBRC 102530 TaxID=3032201 RepID=UPI0024A56697|nr:hypothetical protein [Lentzea sp. NBRC 102530]GLY54770.1 hypothetical protein Lesp01_84250 [Lentzea sp. NBRC 102530]
MDDDARQAVVTALLRLAASSDHRDRADAGRGLASFAEVPAARRKLLELLLDTADTFVTDETTEALVRRGDAEALAIVCAGAAQAGHDHVDHLYGTLCSTLVVYESERDAAVAICQTFLDDPARDEQTRTGAAAVIAALTELRPVLLLAK